MNSATASITDATVQRSDRYRHSRIIGSMFGYRITGRRQKQPKISH